MRAAGWLRWTSALLRRHGGGGGVAAAARARRGTAPAAATSVAAAASRRPLTAMTPTRRRTVAAPRPRTAAVSTRRTSTTTTTTTAMTAAPMTTTTAAAKQTKTAPAKAAATTTMSMLSSVTAAAFGADCQARLREVARQRGYTSRYWVTLPQSRRSCNAIVLPGETPTVVYNEVEFVVPLTSLSRSVQRRILDEHPPFFGSGVGILSQRCKWRAVTAERLVRVLNPRDAERVLYLDVRTAKELGIAYDRRRVLDVRPASSIALYNAQQLDDPYKGEPQRGLALNAITGKRFSQPAHDVLLGVGILRGYTSPMWIAESQMRYLNLELRPGAAAEAVLVPNMTGLIVSLAVLPPACQRELLAELRASHPHAFGSDLYFIYNVNRWEVSHSRALVRNMAAVQDRTYPYHFVNLTDLQRLKPQYAAFVMAFAAGKHARAEEMMRRDAALLPSIALYPSATAADAAPASEDKSSTSRATRGSAKSGKKGGAGGGGTARRGQQQACMLLSSSSSSNTSSCCGNEIVVRSSSSSSDASPSAPRYFFAEDATLRRYYNAVCMTKPHLAVPATRPIAVVDGRLLGHRDEARLRRFALDHKLSSPIWLTERMAHRLGVTILPQHRRKYATIGAAAAAAEHERPGDTDAMGFYNLDDLANPTEVLAVHPKTSKGVHFMLDAVWRPVLGKQRQVFLSSLQRRVPLWVSVNECVVSGFALKPHARLHTFGTRTPSASALSSSSASLSARAAASKPSGTLLYNSQYTSDPVRVIGLSMILTRPQGLTV